MQPCAARPRRSKIELERARGGEPDGRGRRAARRRSLPHDAGRRSRS
jgi:hypothetical protein